MLYPALCAAAVTLLRVVQTKAAFRRYVVALTFFFVISMLAFCVFSPNVTADARAPEAPGSITGVVKNISGEPVANIQVTLYRKTPYSPDYWSPLRAVTTQADGRYRFTILPVGNYRIGAADLKNMYASIFYPTAPTIHQGTDINVAGNQLNGVDLILYPGGRITGVVTATASFSLTAGMVTLHQTMIRQGLPYWETVQAAPLPAGGGAYTFTNLSANTYRVCANGLGVLLATYECYDNVYDISQAIPIPLTGTVTISKVNIVLGDGADYAQLSGRVTDRNHEPLANIDVYPMRDVTQPFAQSVRTKALAPTATPAAPLPPIGGGPPYPPYEFYGSPYARTDGQGNYHLANLPEGNYRLMFSDPIGNYAVTYYGDSSFAESAIVIPLVAKQRVADINVQLAPGSHIRGVVTIAGQPAPIQYLLTQIKTPLGWQYFSGTSPASTDGRYDIGGLPAGTYRVSTAVSIVDFYTNYFYQGYYFDANAVESDTGDLFTEIPLAVGETKTADITLLGGPQFEGSLSGRITANGLPLAGAKVSLYAQNSDCCASSLWQPAFYVFTDAAGRYTVNGLASSTFRLGVSDPTGIYATTYYTAHANPMAANLLAVEDGRALTNIDLDLPLAGAISGRVTRPNGQPVPNLLVAVSMLIHYDATMVGAQQISNEIRTDNDGRYTVKGLHPGDYNVCFNDTERGYTKCYGMLWWSYDLNSGRVKVTAGGTTAGIDLRWGPDLHTYLPIIAQ